MPDGFDIFDKVLLVEELESTLGVRVDIVSDCARSPVGERARSEAVPL
ncbi:hypothetical protein [Ruania rhizosphaerae]|nr:hypothetical protein [Ruania rhizosphaerae]